MSRLLLLIVALCCGIAAVAQAKPSVEVKVHNGRPTVFIDGVPNALPGYSPMAWDKPYTDRQLPRFAAHTMGVYYICPPVVRGDFFGTQFWVGDEVSSTPLVKLHPNDYQGIDDAVETALKLDPGAYIIIRFGIMEPASWKTLHPEQYFVNDEGVAGIAPSMAADLYWDTAAKFTTALITYCESRPWANRVIGYANFHRNEGTFEPAIAGWIFDHSPLMTARWRAWLTAKYATDDALRVAWGDKTLSLAAVEVPKDKLRGKMPDVSRMLYWQAAKDNQPLRDYLELQRVLFHQRYRQLSAAMTAGVAKDRTALFIHDALKQVMQGWDIDDFFVMNEGRFHADPELMSASGSMGVAALFDAPGMDGLITPHDYQARGAGGVFEPEGIADSCVLRGKVFFTEMDQRTYTDKYNGYGRARTLKEFEAITWRNLATCLTRGFWHYWMDLSADWFSAQEMHPIIARQAQVIRDAVHWQHDTVPGIAVILDDQCALETNGAGNYLNEAVMWEMKQGLARCGVPVRTYLLEDLALPNFPAHRVYYFPNLFKVDDARLRLLQAKVFRDGNVVVWGPGSGISDGATISAAHAATLTGFQMEMIPANFSHRVLISDFTHPVTTGLKADTVLGGPLAYGPLLFPTDGQELGLAWTKIGRHATGLAVKSFGKGARGVYAGKDALGAGDYAAVFTHAVPLPADLWRNLARFGGAHVYSDSGDVLLADSSIVALQSLQSGAKTISLPGAYDVYDVVTGKRIARKAKDIRFTLQAPETRVFRLEAEKR
ncbi:MAG TPA: hypothetical protein PLZ36_00780 [Armatimonadota bacterium]|nr:hypothetical protein [Armatimonadota bacterium]